VIVPGANLACGKEDVEHAREIIREADVILTPNETKAELLPGIPTSSESNGWEAQAAALLTTGPKTIIITLGERGAFLATRERSALVPAVRVEPTDTTAAGDAFNGALAVALAEGQAPLGAVSFANIAGAISTMRIGAQPSMPWRDEIEALLARERKE
jgi:ribokinase